jgi:hypothetical protein
MLFNLVKCGFRVFVARGSWFWAVLACALGFEGGRYLWHRGRGGRQLALEMEGKARRGGTSGDDRHT